MPKDTKPPSAAGERSVRAVERAADILFCFTEEHPILDLRMLHQATGLSRPTLYRLLHTLEKKGLVFSFGTPQRFQLGHALAPLARTWDRSPALVALAQPALEVLWRETRETVALMIPVSATMRMCVAELKSPQAISFSRGTGYTEPLYRGASGKVILAHSPPERVRAALAGLDAAAQRKVLNDLPKIRKRGVWHTVGEVIPGTVAVAAAVLDERRVPVASVCVFGTETRMQGEALRRCEQRVAGAAREISSAI
jgi:DNA-binding IclR family transcriptional regulator